MENFTICKSYESMLTDKLNQHKIGKTLHPFFKLRIQLHTQHTILRTTWSSVSLTRGWSKSPHAGNWGSMILLRMKYIIFLILMPTNEANDLRNYAPPLQAISLLLTILPPKHQRERRF